MTKERGNFHEYVCRFLRIWSKLLNPGFPGTEASLTYLDFWCPLPFFPFSVAVFQPQKLLRRPRKRFRVQVTKFIGCCWLPAPYHMGFCLGFDELGSAAQRRHLCGALRPTGGTCYLGTEQNPSAWELKRGGETLPLTLSIWTRGVDSSVARHVTSGRCRPKPTWTTFPLHLQFPEQHLHI